MQQSQMACLMLDPVSGAEWALALNAGSNCLDFGSCLRFIDIGDPIFRQTYWGLREFDTPRTLHHAPPKAAPMPMLRAPNEPSAERIALHITHDGNQVMVLLNRKRFEAPLPYATRTLVLPVMAPDVGREEPMRPSREILVSCRANHEMHVVRHQAGCEYWHLDKLLGLGDQR